jgi:hypothetical protein
VCRVVAFWHTSFETRKDFQKKKIFCAPTRTNPHTNAAHGGHHLPNVRARVAPRCRTHAPPPSAREIFRVDSPRRGDQVGPHKYDPPQREMRLGKTPAVPRASRHRRGRASTPRSLAFAPVDRGGRVRGPELWRRRRCRVNPPATRPRQRVRSRPARPHGRGCELPIQAGTCCAFPKSNDCLQPLFECTTSNTTSTASNTTSNLYH